MKITTPKTLAAAIRDKRKKMKFTQKNAAELVGMKQSTVSAFENDPEKCKLETLFKLLSALELQLVITERNPDKDTNNGWTEEW
ncbi:MULTISPECIES: helix-turn-helix domain-containing protein [Xenorhabdus]|uniref:helix-turn-helix domain-containing protein n=1 Tax=Xenorhabdus TaxID=626 RepID=UPI00064B5C36|nr:MULTISPECIES: helix-turn-helix domain-containing protein [Xenorhabdus]KLU17197.1 XRE family transcriptional regulator [Xenorhabdus griffiniae]KOP32727.1 XRE family transcriptional regulator [Xenorhabdus sp. GDc328]